MIYARKNSEPLVECHGIGSKKTAAVPLPKGTVEVFPGANLDYKSSLVRLCVASAVEPELECEYNLSSGELNKLHQPMPGRELLGLVVSCAGS